MQRLLWASTKTKDPAASDTLYVHGLAAPFTVNTMPDDTLKDFYDHGEVGDPMPEDGGDADALLARFGDAGVDTKELAATLQRDGASAFVDSWHELLNRIAREDHGAGRLSAHTTRAPRSQEAERRDTWPLHPCVNGPPTRPSPSTMPRSRVGICATCLPKIRRAGNG